MTKAIATVIALGLAMPAQAAIMLNYQPGGTTLPVGASVIEDFESFATGASLGTNARVYASNVGSQAARPAFGSTGKFGVVLGNPVHGSYTINFAPASVLSFQLGSLDTYNRLILNFANRPSITYQGGQIINDLVFPSGNQISGETNGRITYTATAGEILTGATFQSTGNSFEFDNIATRGAVPEPATWGMLILGFGIIGTSMRRNKTRRISFV